MRLIDPIEIRKLYAETHGWFTLQEIANGTKVAIGSVSAALNGKSVRHTTIKALAAPLNKKVTEIAEFTR